MPDLKRNNDGYVIFIEISVWSSQYSMKDEEEEKKTVLLPITF